jgi:hypothetical protein
MNTTSPHLTLGELTSPAAEADEHLTACAECAAEAASWAAVAAGIQLIVSGTQPPSAVLDGVRRAVETDRRGMRRRPVLTASAAAAAVALAAGGYGLSAALGPGGRHTPARAQVAAALTATGCSGIDLTKGTLKQVTGQDLVLTAPNGTAVTVTTSASTTILRGVIGSPGDIADGEHVQVKGTITGGVIAASGIVVTPSSSPAPPAPPAPAKPGITSGTVASAASGGFDVVTASGTRVRVTTSSSTRVRITERTSLSQLRTGDATSAVGTAGPDGTLAASTVAQGAFVPPLNPALPQPVKPTRPTLSKLRAGLPTPLAKQPSSALPGTNSSGGLKLNEFGCAPESITTSYLLSAGN